MFQTKGNANQDQNQNYNVSLVNLSLSHKTKIKTIMCVCVCIIYISISCKGHMCLIGLDTYSCSSTVLTGIKFCRELHFVENHYS